MECDESLVSKVEEALETLKRNVRILPPMIYNLDESSVQNIYF
jgi:hypothetical protein